MYHRVTLGVLSLIVIWAIHSTWSVYKKKMESESLMNISKQRVDNLRSRNDDLDYKISRLDTEVGVEEEIRSKFSVTKDNESMVVVVPDQSVASSSVEKEESFWTKLINIFK
jgi:hypothetical protein